MITVAEMRAYLVSQGVDVLVVSGLEELESPDRLLFVTPSGGAGETMERMFELNSVQIRTRGVRNNPADAFALADRVDRALMDVEYPLRIGGRHVTKVQWAGGPPALVERDAALRSVLSASYVFEVSRHPVALP